MKIRNIFNKKVDSITPDATLLDAAKVIFGRNHKGIPVVKPPKKKIIGFITEQDILSQLFPNMKDLVEDYIHEKNFEAMEKKMSSILTKKVKDVMSKKIISIHVDKPVLEAMSIMKLNDISRLPVVDKKRNLIGIISKGDIFRALVNLKTRMFK